MSEAFGIHEVFPADLTLEWSFAGVEVLVFYGVGALPEGLATYRAFVLPGGALVTSHVGLRAVLARGLVVAKVTGVFAVFAVSLGVDGEVYVVVERLLADRAD